MGGSSSITGSATPAQVLKEMVPQLRVLLNPKHPQFRVLPYVELLAHLQDPHPCPLYPDQLLLTKLAQDFITREQEAHLEREQTGEYIVPGGIQTSCHNVNFQQH